MVVTFILTVNTHHFHYFCVFIVMGKYSPTITITAERLSWEENGGVNVAIIGGTDVFVRCAKALCTINNYF